MKSWKFTFDAAVSLAILSLLTGIAGTLLAPHIRITTDLGADPGLVLAGVIIAGAIGYLVAVIVGGAIKPRA